MTSQYRLTLLASDNTKSQTMQQRLDNLYTELSARNVTYRVVDGRDLSDDDKRQQAIRDFPVLLFEKDNITTERFTGVWDDESIRSAMGRLLRR